MLGLLPLMWLWLHTALAIAAIWIMNHRWNFTLCLSILQINTIFKKNGNPRTMPPPFSAGDLGFMLILQSVWSWQVNIEEILRDGGREEAPIEPVGHPVWAT